jgi:hypothetical protein
MEWAAPSLLNKNADDSYPKTDGRGVNEYHESSISIENEEDLMLSPPQIPNIHAFSLPLIGRMQVTQMKQIFVYFFQEEGC